MTDDDSTATKPGGSLASWTDAFRDVLAGTSKTGMDVPCGDCNACCRSGYFIHIEPDETAALATIPDVLLFPAPSRPAGHRVMGYDEQGRCPMLLEGRCSIYDTRPRTCRSYDCRMFAAAAVSPGDDKPLVAARAQRWQFACNSSEDAQMQQALRDAAMLLAKHPEAAPGNLPDNPAEHAAFVIRAAEALREAPAAATPDGLIARVAALGPSALDH